MQVGLTQHQTRDALPVCPSLLSLAQQLKKGGGKPVSGTIEWNASASKQFHGRKLQSKPKLGRGKQLRLGRETAILTWNRMYLK